MTMINLFSAKQYYESNVEVVTTYFNIKIMNQAQSFDHSKKIMKIDAVVHEKTSISCQRA